MVPVEVEDVVKEMSELVQLEVREEALSNRRELHLLLRPADECAPGMFCPTAGRAPPLHFPFNKILISGWDQARKLAN